MRLRIAEPRGADLTPNDFSIARFAPDLDEPLTAGDLVLHPQERLLEQANRQIALSRRELCLLRVFMSEPGHVFTRAELSLRVWHRRHRRAAKMVEVAIGRLRRKLGPERIQTIRHVGYRLQSEG